MRRLDDLCECGDYRSQHEYDGKKYRRCRVCGSLYAPYEGCQDFRWSRSANADERKHWLEYHEESPAIAGTPKSRNTGISLDGGKTIHSKFKND